MRLKLTYQRSGESSSDVVVTVDATATVGDVADAIARADHESTSSEPYGSRTVRLHGDERGQVRVLDPGSPIADSGIRAGATVSLAPRAERFRGGLVDAAAAAIIRVIAGPGSGRELSVPLGSAVIGREHDCQVRLDDPLVSRHHARLNVGDVVEVIDTGSSNGVLVNGGLVTRAVLRVEDVVTVGDTSMMVGLVRARADSDSTGSVDFNRSPRLDPTFVGDPVELPEPPAPVEPPRLPVIAMVAPLIMGSVLYAVTRSVLSIVFVALSPLLMIGTYIDNRLQLRRKRRAANEQFVQAVVAAIDDLSARAELERTMRLAENPSSSEIVDAWLRRTPLLWTRRPEHVSFGQLRLGLGTRPSRTTTVLPSRRQGDPTHVAQLIDVAKRFATIDSVPVVVDLRDSGSLGVAGGTTTAVGAARSLVVQLAGLHSPAELVITAVGSAAMSDGWGWLRWLPHTGSPSSPIAAEHLAADPGTAARLVAEIEGLVTSRAAAGGSATQRERRGRAPRPDTEYADPPMPSLILLVDDDASVDRSRLVWLAEHGADVGVYVVWLAPSVQRLPAACRTFLAVDDATGTGITGHVRTGEAVQPVGLETVDADLADRLARHLAPVVDSGARIADDSDLPRAVSFVSLAGNAVATDPSAVVERWRESGSLVAIGDGTLPRGGAGLRAVVGQGAAGPMTLDLRTNGPHALVGGTTGAGKSEFLQAWILGLAAGSSPLRVTFLFVDYKGGAAFADCVRLPHTAGLVTDLSPHLVRRALTSLRAELHYRERILNRHKAKDLLDLERSSPRDAPPALIIVVDEFAALAGEVPEFVDGIVDVAQRGRSLGLHLILATQRPSGIITGSLRANTNLRVALRMNDADDANDVLGDPIAATFDPAIPGRAAVRTGPSRIDGFQAAYAGGWTATEASRPRIEVAELRFGPPRVWQAPDDPEEAARAEALERSPKDITRVVDNIAAAARELTLAEPRRPWLPVLAPAYDWAAVTQRTDAELALGVIDRPDNQEQGFCYFRPEVDGHLAVFGTGGSGRSTVLRTIAASAGVHPRGGPVHVYGLDFGASGLRMIEELPHVGGIVSGDDEERVGRLMRMLREVAVERGPRYAALQASSLDTYRTLADRPDEPRIVLLVDGLATFRQEYEFTTGRQWVFTALGQLVSDGRAVGIHVVVTADRGSTLPASLASGIQRRLVLRLASEDDYALLGVPNDVLDSASPPGRGVLDGLEIQVAVLGGSASTATQGRETTKLAQALRRAGVSAAPAVRRLPERVALSTLPRTLPPSANDGRDRAVIGIADVDLEPTGLLPARTFLIAGPQRSGRTTALLTIVSALRRWQPDLRLAYLGPPRSAVRQLPGWYDAANSIDEVAELAARLAGEINLATPSPAPLAVIVESASSFAGGSADGPLLDLAKACRANDIFLVAEAETTGWKQYSPWLTELKAARRGLALQPDQPDGDTIFGTGFPARLPRADFPPGRGLLVEEGRVRKVQIALPE